MSRLTMLSHYPVRYGGNAKWGVNKGCKPMWSVLSKAMGGGWFVEKLCGGVAAAVKGVG